MEKLDHFNGVKLTKEVSNKIALYVAKNPEIQDRSNFIRCAINLYIRIEQAHEKTGTTRDQIRTLLRGALNE